MDSFTVTWKLYFFLFNSLRKSFRCRRGNYMLSSSLALPTVMFLWYLSQNRHSYLWLYHHPTLYFSYFFFFNQRTEVFFLPILVLHLTVIFLRSYILHKKKQYILNILYLQNLVQKMAIIGTHMLLDLTIRQRCCIILTVISNINVPYMLITFSWTISHLLFERWNLLGLSN